MSMIVITTIMLFYYYFVFLLKILVHPHICLYNISNKISILGNWGGLMKKLFTICIAMTLFMLGGCTTKNPTPETSTPEEVLKSIRTSLNEKEEITAKLYNTAVINTDAQFEEEGTYTSNNKKADIKTVFYTIEDDMRIESGELWANIIGTEGRIHGDSGTPMYPFGQYEPTISDYLIPKDNIQVRKEGTHTIYTYRHEHASSICVELDEQNMLVNITVTQKPNTDEIIYHFTDFKYS